MDAAAARRPPALPSRSRDCCAAQAGPLAYAHVPARAWHPSVAGIVLLYCAVAMFSFVLFKRRRWSRSHKLAEKYLGHARLLVQSQEPGDVYAAIGLLDGALKLHPNWERALELKARCLLSLRRFREVATLLYEYIPSLKYEDNTPPDSPVAEKVKLLSGYLPDRGRRKSVLKYLSFSKIRKKLHAGLTKRGDREEWRYLVLGQACCHLGMLEDAMVLLQNGKRAACAAFRRHSNGMDDDSFCYENAVGPSESDLVSHLLGNIKFLLRRRSAALAAMEAGLYTEAVRHFSKILDGRRGTPQGFIAECYMHRAVAYQAAGRIPDAIADCNRTLALDPVCVEALGTRASLYEIIRCFYECFQDLEQLKLLYEAILRHRRSPGAVWRLTQTAEEMDMHANYQAVIHKIDEIRLRLEHGYSIDYHRILGVPYICSRGQVERAHLLICLKHRPDKAAHFVDRCEFVDDRDIEAVKEEARLAAIKLFCLIQRAHSGVIGLILDHEEAMREKREGGGKDVEDRLPDSQSVGERQQLSDRQLENNNLSWFEYPKPLEVSSPESLPLSIKAQLGSPSSVSQPLVSETVAEVYHVEVVDLRFQTENNCIVEQGADNRSKARSLDMCAEQICLDEAVSSNLPFGLAELEVGPETSDIRSTEQAIHKPDPACVVPQLETTGTLLSDSAISANSVCVTPGAPLADVQDRSSVFSCLEDELVQAETVSPAGAVTCRELAVVGVKLSSALTPSTWVNPNDNWCYQGYGTISLQIGCRLSKGGSKSHTTWQTELAALDAAKSAASQRVFTGQLTEKCSAAYSNGELRRNRLECCLAATLAIAFLDKTLGTVSEYPRVSYAALRS